MNKTVFRAETDGFHGAWYPCADGSRKGIIAMIGDSSEDRMVVSAVKWLHRLGVHVMAMSPDEKDYGFHHYPNPQDFFNSVHRCLRPGGMLILRDYAADGFVGFFMNRIELPMVNFFGHGDVRISSEAELRTMCANAGLTVERFEQLKGRKMNLIASKPGISG